MLFRQLFDKISSTYTYILAADYGREGVIIDPVLEHTDRYVKLLQEYQVKLVATLDTHVHADHVTASGVLKQKTQCEIFMGEHAKASCIDRKLSDKEILNFDGFDLKVIYTPGHTDDSYCYLCNDKLFTGDTLLIRGTGRTDFQHGSSDEQYHSIFEKLFKLDPRTKVYPGHDYNGMTMSTIAEEMQNNPRLQVKSQQEYANIMDNLNLPNPKLIDVAVPANLNCGIES